MQQNTSTIDVFDKWKVFPCANCEAYKPLSDLINYGALVVCKCCQMKLERARAEREQIGLFEDNPTLFD